MRLDEDAGVLLVGLAEVFAGGYGLIDLLLEVGGGGDAGAVAADSAEAGEGLAVGPEVAWLALTLDCHGEHEGEGVFACSSGAREDEGVGKATGGDGCTEVFDCGGVTDKVIEGCRLRHRFPWCLCPVPKSRKVFIRRELCLDFICKLLISDALTIKYLKSIDYVSSVPLISCSLLKDTGFKGWGLSSDERVSGLICWLGAIGIVQSSVSKKRVLAMPSLTLFLVQKRVDKCN